MFHGPDAPFGGQEQGSRFSILVGMTEATVAPGTISPHSPPTASSARSSAVSEPTARPAKGEVRADIQALRALAVVSVMMFHLWPLRITGGYVGVDVFFAISGFLITSHLLSEVDRRGTLSLPGFWARRAKRLVPASTLVLVFALVGTVLVVPRYLWRQFLQEIVSSALQFENWLLAHNSVDYLAAANQASPTQHFWTLAVEEQFYVGLPLLLLLCAGIARFTSLPRRAVILGMLVLVGLASLAYSIWLTHTTPSVAYFSTGTRAWEFSIGSLLAWTGVTRRPGALWVRALPWAGVAAIVVAIFGFTARTPFPSYWAALPVLGAAAVLWAGEGSIVDRIGSLPPVALLGRISYSAYLWHWPMIILLPYATGHILLRNDKIAILGLTVLLSWLSTSFLEDPIRFSPRLLGRRRPRTVAAWCAPGVAAVVLLAMVTSQHETRHEHAQAAAARTIAGEHQRCLGAESLDPAFSPCSNPKLDGLLVPMPAVAKQDDDNMLDCWGNTASGPKVCHLGPTSGYTKKIYAIGDSHNNTLIGVYRTIAEHQNWRIDVSGVGGCYLTDGVQDMSSQGQRDGCKHWRQQVTAIANQGGYDAIIVTHSDAASRIVPPPGQTLEAATVNGLVSAWNKLPQVPIVAIRDNPHMLKDTMDCVNKHLDDAGTTCAVPRSVAFGYPDGQAQAALRVPRARVVDLSDLYCTRDACAPVVGHVLVYRDTTHLTATYASTMAPYFEARIVAYLK